MCQRRNYELRSVLPDKRTYLGGNKSKLARVRMRKNEEKNERKKRFEGNLRSRFCCMESDRYRLTVLFLKTFFRSWARSVKLHTHRATFSVLAACWAPQADLMTHTSRLSKPLQSAGTCQLLYLLVQTPCRETLLCRRRKKNKAILWEEYLKQQLGQKAFL